MMILSGSDGNLKMWDVREGGVVRICWMYKVFGRLCARGDGVLMRGEMNFTVVLLLSRLDKYLVTNELSNRERERIQLGIC